MASIPPQFENLENWEFHSSGGDNNTDWISIDKTKLYTNAYVISEGKILLGFKKRGFGKAIYNGFGGKVEPGETVQQAAARELKEESGLDADPIHYGTFFYCEEGADHTFQIELFRVDSYTGEPIETDEMRPEWFQLEGGDGRYPPVPWDKLWASDKYWLPLVLSRRFVIARSDFKKSVQESEGASGYTIQRWWVGTKGV